MNDREGGGRKTLLPEFLSAPGPSTTLTPRDRVARRAQIFLQRFRGLGTTAGAAVISLQCSGYGVVDPLPPPPLQCNTLADPFPQIGVWAFFSSSKVDGAAPLVLDFRTNRYPNYIGFGIDAVRVTDGTLVGLDDKSTGGQGGGTHFQVTITPAPNTSQLLVDVDFRCSGRGARPVGPRADGRPRRRRSSGFSSAAADPAAQSSARARDEAGCPASVSRCSLHLLSLRGSGPRQGRARAETVPARRSNFSP
jgi:hypothetical protein